MWLIVGSRRNIGARLIDSLWWMGETNLFVLKGIEDRLGEDALVFDVLMVPWNREGEVCK